MIALKLCAEEECPAEFQSSAGRFAIKHFGDISFRGINFQSFSVYPQQTVTVYSDLPADSL